MLLDDRDHLVNGQNRGDALGRAADRGRTAPPGLERRQLGERRLDVRVPRLEGADRELLVGVPGPLLEAGVEGDHHGGETVAHHRGGAVRRLDDRDLPTGAGLVLDLPRLQGRDHLETLLLHGVAVLLGLFAREQPLLHGADAIRQGDLEIHDGGGDGGQRTGALGRGRLLRPRVVPGGEGLRAGVPTPRERVRRSDETDPAGRGLEALAPGPDRQDRHRADGVYVRAQRHEGAVLGRELDAHRLLDRGARGVAARVLRIDIPEGAPGRQAGLRDLDSEDLTREGGLVLGGELGVLGGDGGRGEGAELEHCFLPPGYLFLVVL